MTIFCRAATDPPKTENQTKEKKEEMDRRLNILQSFQPKSPASNIEL